MTTWRGSGVKERVALGSVARGARLSPSLYLSGVGPTIYRNNADIVNAEQKQNHFFHSDNKTEMNNVKTNKPPWSGSLSELAHTPALFAATENCTRDLKQRY